MYVVRCSRRSRSMTADPCSTRSMRWERRRSRAVAQSARSTSPCRTRTICSWTCRRSRWRIRTRSSCRLRSPTVSFPRRFAAVECGRGGSTLTQGFTGTVLLAAVHPAGVPSPHGSCAPSGAASLHMTSLKRSSAVPLALVPALSSVVACGPSQPQMVSGVDPCLPQVYNEVACQYATQHQGYYYGGMWYHHVYAMPFIYYHNGYSGYVGGGGRVPSLAEVAYRPDAVLVRGSLLSVFHGADRDHRACHQRAARALPGCRPARHRRKTVCGAPHSRPRRPSHHEELGGRTAVRVRPFRSRLRWYVAAEDARVQRGHADLTARGIRHSVGLAPGTTSGRRPVQFHARQTGRLLAGRH